MVWQATLFPQKPDFKQVELSHECSNLFQKDSLSAGCDTNPSKQHSSAKPYTIQYVAWEQGERGGKMGKALSPLVEKIRVSR